MQFRALLLSPFLTSVFLVLCSSFPPTSLLLLHIFSLTHLHLSLLHTHLYSDSHSHLHTSTPHTLLHHNPHIRWMKYSVFRGLRVGLATALDNFQCNLLYLA